MELKTEGARILYAYWDSLRAGRPLPCSSDIDLVDIASILPNTIIYSATADNDFRFRFFGTALVRAVGADLTGLRISDIMEKEDAIDSNEGFMKILAGSLAAANLYHSTAQEGGDHESEHLLLPLADANGKGVEILCHAKRVARANEPKTFAAGAFSGLKITQQQVVALGGQPLCQEIRSR